MSLKFSKNTRFAFLFFQQMMHSIEVEREREKKKSKYDYPNDSPSLFFVLRLLISFNREIFEQLPRRLLLNQQWTFIVSLKKHTEQCHATNIERLRRRRIFKIDKIWLTKKKSMYWIQSNSTNDWTVHEISIGIKYKPSSPLLII